MHLKLEKEGDWVRVKGPRIKKFQDAIRYGVRPPSYRRWDLDTQQWKVHWKFLPLLAQMSRKYYTNVDWSSLPGRWQMFAVGSAPPSEEPLTEAPKPDPYAQLHLLESAPMEVVKAVYRVLATLHHPDKQDGNSTRMADVNAAYKEICRIRSSST